MSEESYPVANVRGQEIPYDPEQLRRISEHPCFSEKACHSFGRMHLAVAPKCNIQCKYCIRDFDCVNESRPGVTSQVLKPKEALERVDQVLEKYHYIKVVAVAGPGEPLANEETFETLRLIHEEFPHLIMCISTNGLLLPEKIDELQKYDVGNVTVTLNAVDPAVGEKIYSFVDYHGKHYTGREAAEILLKNQLEGIRMAVERKMFVKVNCVYIPGVNDDHIVEIAKKAGELGAFSFNLIPLIPQYKFAEVVPPTAAEKKAMQDRCAPYIKQMRHCARCRSDAIGKLGQDVQANVYSGCNRE